MTPKSIETNGNQINFYDGAIRKLCLEAKENGSIHSPFLVEFIDPENNIKVFETKVDVERDGTPSWTNREYPHFSGELLVTLSDGARLSRVLDTKHLKVMPVGSTREAASSAAD